MTDRITITANIKSWAAVKHLSLAGCVQLLHTTILEPMFCSGTAPPQQS